MPKSITVKSAENYFWVLFAQDWISLSFGEAPIEQT